MKEEMNMFGMKASNKPAVHRKGQALKVGITKRKKTASSTIAVYGTSTIIGKVKAN